MKPGPLQLETPGSATAALAVMIRLLHTPRRPPIVARTARGAGEGRRHQPAPQTLDTGTRCPKPSSHRPPAVVRKAGGAEEGERHQPGVAVHGAEGQPVLAVHAVPAKGGTSDKLLTAEPAGGEGSLPERRMQTSAPGKSDAQHRLWRLQSKPAHQASPQNRGSDRTHLAKLMPSTGSGTSGGTSSTGRSTVQVPSGWPYLQAARSQRWRHGHGRRRGNDTLMQPAGRTEHASESGRASRRQPGRAHRQRFSRAGSHCW